MNRSGIRMLKLAGALPALAVAAVLALPPALAAPAASANPGVFPPNSKPYGKTYGEWAVAYWQWAMSIPTADNPWYNDPDGANSANGQSGPVWFLGGTAGGSVTRDVTIPAGKSVLLPVHQWIFGSMAFDCDPSVPGVACDVPTLQASAAFAAEAVSVMDVTIDGKSISNVANYRALSPGAFSVTVPGGTDNFVGFSGGPLVAAGTYSPHVADGYYLILASLSAGQHTIMLHVESTLGFDYDHTYNITVSAP